MVNVTIIAIVAFAVIVLYVVERYTSQKQIHAADAVKLTTLSAAVTGGVLYAIEGGAVSAIPDAVTDVAQDMFVGKPSF